MKKLIYLFLGLLIVACSDDSSSGQTIFEKYDGVVWQEDTPNDYLFRIQHIVNGNLITANTFFVEEGGSENCESSTLPISDFFDVPEDFFLRLVRTRVGTGRAMPRLFVPAVALMLLSVASGEDPCKAQKCRCDLRRLDGKMVCPTHQRGRLALGSALIVLPLQTPADDILKLEEPVILTGLTDGWAGTRSSHIQSARCGRACNDSQLCVHSCVCEVLHKRTFALWCVVRNARNEPGIPFTLT